jgi:hypothetical protein
VLVRGLEGVNCRDNCTSCNAVYSLDLALLQVVHIYTDSVHCVVMCGVDDTVCCCVNSNDIDIGRCLLSR